jgi:N-acyl-D-aspartate/D-glutamate deacylase
VHDLVIDNARLIDGLGTPARDGSLAVTDGRIAAISPDRRGADLGAAGARVDAQGLVLAPGIVDLHTHYDAQLTWDPYATPSTALGVTTVVIGNCGFTIAPCHPAHRDLIVRNLTHVEGMSLEAMRAGINWDFESYPEYLASLERRGLVPNVASFVGHSSVRTYVLGEEASGRRPTRRSWRCAASWWRPCGPAPSASRPPPSSNTTARTASRCRRAWPTSAR